VDLVDPEHWNLLQLLALLIKTEDPDLDPEKRRKFHVLKSWMPFTEGCMLLFQALIGV
jgi:hypothetical protein